jgi:hypothetical protein
VETTRMRMDFRIPVRTVSISSSSGGSLNLVNGSSSLGMISLGSPPENGLWFGRGSSVSPTAVKPPHPSSDSSCGVMTVVLDVPDGVNQSLCP